MSDATLDGEVVGFCASPPCPQLSEGEEDGQDYETKRPLSTARGRGSV